MTPKSFHKEELEGKTVIDSLGNVRGKIKDLVFGLDGSVALIIENMEGSEARVPLSRILGISDYVIMKSDAAPDTSMPAMSAMTGAPTAPAQSLGFGTSTACKFCGTPIPADTTYCPSCGRSKI